MRRYPYLLSPGLIGTLTVKNRVIMAPMATNFVDPNGVVTESLIHYYVERARGGVGLIIVENANIDYPLGNNGAVQLRIDEDRFLPQLARLREAIYDAAPTCKVAIQLNHAGGQTMAVRTGGRQVVAPSNVPTHTGGEIPRPLTVEEIKLLSEKFSVAAGRAQKAGFDAVEIHGGFGYLLAQFLSPLCNKRQDQYGGSVENRALFPVEVVKQVRQAVGPKFPIFFRINGDECIPGGSTLTETVQYARMLETASVNLLHVTAGCGFCPERHIEPMPFPQAAKASIAAALKAAVSIPVAAVGVIREPSVAEQILAEHQADFVALGRTLIADPHWVNKVSHGKGFTHCLSCNECARRRVYSGLPIRCSVNPLAGNECLEEERRHATLVPQKILIAGGGPAGLKAAVEAAKDGHHVTLLEKARHLGGRAVIAARPPHKEKIQWLLQDLERDARQHGVNFQLETAVTATVIRQMRPDIVVIATGSESIVPAWLSADPHSCITAEELLSAQYRPENNRIAIIGGGSVGCETAEYLKEAGNEVTVIEMAAHIAPDLEPITRANLMARLKEKGVRLQVQSQVIKIAAGTITYEYTGQQTTMHVDKIIYAGGFRKTAELLETINKWKDQPTDVYVIGDCRRPGRFVDALRQAYMAIRDIRNKGYSRGGKNS